MLLKIKILSPFKYEYKQLKSHWLMAGDYYHLDSIQDENEIKYILSPQFPYKNYIHVDKETLPADYLEEYDDITSSDTAGIPLADGDFSKPEPLVISPEKPVHDLFEEDPLPTPEPEPNYFAAQIEEKKIKIEDTKKVAEAKEEKIEELPEEVDDPAVGGKAELETRRAELDELHWQKVKDVGETYGIEYTKKQEVIDKILAIEFE